MTGIWRKNAVRTRPLAGSAHAWLGAIAACLLIAVSASAQQATPQPAPQASPPVSAQPAKPRTNEPGLLNALGRFFEDSIDNLNTTLRGARGRVDDAGTRAGAAARDATEVARDAARDAAGAARGATDVARDAADTVVRLPGTRIVTGRTRCELAPNGAPDCRTAANAMCRTGGHTSGRSLDIQSAERCPGRVVLSGRTEEDACRTETFVTRAVCQ